MWNVTSRYPFQVNGILIPDIKVTLGVLTLYLTIKPRQQRGAGRQEVRLFVQEVCVSTVWDSVVSGFQNHTAMRIQSCLFLQSLCNIEIFLPY